MPRKTGLEHLREVYPVTMPLPLNKNDYPGCLESWEEATWERLSAEKKELGKFKSGVRGEGINSSWLEKEDGTRVPVVRQSLILGEARRTWITMRDFGIELVSFHDTPIPTRDYFRATMETQYIELRLCADHWKADKLWKENFSSWKQGPRPPKKEPQADEDGTPSKTVSEV